MHFKAIFGASRSIHQNRVVKSLAFGVLAHVVKRCFAIRNSPLIIEAQTVSRTFCVNQTGLS